MPHIPHILQHQKKTENLYRNNSLRFSRNFTFITSAWRFPFPAPIFRRCYLKKNPNGYVLLKIQIDPSHSQLFPQPQALPGPILCQGLHCLHPRKQGPSICWSDHLGARHGVFVRTGIIKNKWVSEWMNEWMTECMNAWMHEWMN